MLIWLLSHVIQYWKGRIHGNETDTSQNEKSLAKDNEGKNKEGVAFCNIWPCWSHKKMPSAIGGYKEAEQNKIDQDGTEKRQNSSNRLSKLATIAPSKKGFWYVLNSIISYFYAKNYMISQYFNVFRNFSIFQVQFNCSFK